jgi:hypothetical protein
MGPERVHGPATLLQWKEELEARVGLQFEILDKDYIQQVRQERGFGVNPWKRIPDSWSRKGSWWTNLTLARSRTGACFLYAGEEGRLQNRVEELWIRGDERRRRGDSFALIKKLAWFVDHALSGVFGHEVMSLRMVC